MPAAKPKSPPDVAPVAVSYEAAMAELEQLVTDMEGGKLDLEASLAAYKRGAALLRFCQGALGDAEQQVQILENDTLVPLGGADNDDDHAPD